MRKIFVFMLACMFVAVSAAGAFAIVYGEAGYELEGYDKDSAWEINSAEVLVKVRDDINANKFKIGKYYKLTADIDISSYTDWEPIGKDDNNPFFGHFNGNGHTITVSISRTDTIYAGLFGYVEGGIIENLSVADNIRLEVLDGYVGGEFCAGGIVAYMYGGSINKCNFDGRVNLATADYSDSIYGGGIVGYAYSFDGHVVKLTNNSVGKKNSSTLVKALFDFENNSNTYAGGIVGKVYNNTNGTEIIGNYSRLKTQAGNTDTLTYGYRDNDVYGTFADNTEVDPDDDPDPVPTITAPAITTSSLPNAATGDSPITWAVYSGSLPAGLTLSDTGAISGTPATADTYTFTVKAVNSAGEDKKAFTLTVNEIVHQTLETTGWTLTEGKLVVETNGTPSRWVFDPLSDSNGHGFAISGGTFPAGLTIHLPENWELDIWTDNDESRITASNPSKVKKGEEVGLVSGTVKVFGSNDITLNIQGIEMTAWSIDVIPATGETVNWTRENGKLIVETSGNPSRYEFDPLEGTNGDGFVIGGDFPSGLVINLPAKWGIDIDTSYSVTVSDTAKIIPHTEIPDLPSTTHRIMGSNNITLNAPGIVMTAFLFTEPTITTAENLGTFKVGGNISVPLEAEGTKWTMKWTASNLPEGLKIDADTGLISGKISASGVHRFTVTAENCAGKNSRTFSLTVEAKSPSGKIPVITTKKLPDGFDGTYYSFTLSADSDVTEWMIDDATPLPLGVDLDAETGEISGTMSVSGNKTYRLKFYAKNDAGTSKVKIISLKTSAKTPEFKTDTLKAAKWNTSYNQAVKVANMKVTLWEVDGVLPEGITFSKGRFSGKAKEAGVFEDITITAGNGAVSIEKDFTLTVNVIKPQITGSLKPGKEGEFYSVTLKAKGTTPIEWDIENLPAGLDYAPSETGETCVISGTPEEAFNQKVIINLNNGDDESDTVTKYMSMRVKAVKPVFSTKASDIQNGKVGEDYECQVSLKASPFKVEWELDGNVPDGLYISDEGLIYGVPMTAGKNYRFKVWAINANDTSLRKSLNVTMTIDPADNTETPATHHDENPESSSPELPSGVTYYERGEITSEITARAANSGEIIAAVLPALEVDEEGRYDFTVSLDVNVPEGGLLVWHSYPDGEYDESDKDNAIFLDDEDNPIERVPESYRVTVEAWLVPGKVYEPVITVKISR